MSQKALQRVLQARRIYLKKWQISGPASGALPAPAKRLLHRTSPQSKLNLCQAVPLSRRNHCSYKRLPQGATPLVISVHPVASQHLCPFMTLQYQQDTNEIMPYCPEILQSPQQKTPSHCRPILVQ